MNKIVRFILLFIFFIETINLYSQYPTSIVFVDVSNIRAGHSLSSKIIGKLRQLEKVEVLYNEEDYKDTINGISNSWLPILYKNKKAFIWGGNLAKEVLEALNDKNDIILFNRVDSNIVKLKVFRNNTFIYKDTLLVNPVSYVDLSINSFGKTYYTDSYIFSIETRGFDDYRKVYYKLYEWNGKEIKKSKIKLVDDSKITEKYIDFPYSIINNNMAALRVAPDTNATIAYRLPINTKIKIKVAHLNKRTFWHKVEWNNKEYFIAYKDLCLTIRYIKSNKYKGVSFLYANNAVFAFKNDSIIDKLKIPVRWGREELYEIFSLGIDLGLDFLGVKVRCHTEGCEFGQDIYSWDGTQIKYFCSDLNWGDFGLYGGENYSFSKKNGKNSIYYCKYDDMIFNNPLSGINSMYGGFSVPYENFEKELAYNGDSLIEIPSKYSRVRNYLKINYPDFKFQHSIYHDINKDGNEDVIIYIYKSNEYEKPIEEPKILILFSDNSGSFKSVLENNNIIKGDNYGVKFDLINGKLTIYIFNQTEKTQYWDEIYELPEEYYKDAVDNSDDGLESTIYTFIFKSNIDKLIVQSKETYIGFDTDYEVYNWLKIKTANSEKGVSFENVGK